MCIVMEVLLRAQQSMFNNGILWLIPVRVVLMTPPTLVHSKTQGS